MLDRRRLLAALAALILPASRSLAAPAAPFGAPAGPLAGPLVGGPAATSPVASATVRVVDGWVVTGRDLAEISRLAR